MYLVYLPDVGGPSKPLIQKHVGRRPARLPNDQEEDQSRNPRRRRAYDGIARSKHLEVRHDRRVSPTVNSSRDANLSKKLAVAPTSRIMRAPFRVLGGIIDAHSLIRRERGSLQWQG